MHVHASPAFFLLLVTATASHIPPSSSSSTTVSMVLRAPANTFEVPPSMSTTAPTAAAVTQEGEEDESQYYDNTQAKGRKGVPDLGEFDEDVCLFGCNSTASNALVRPGALAAVGLGLVVLGLWA
ncbi:hypothetical protein B0T20DRAFT_471465 [Sordaria brevicollis]|uniref:Uncharacterized protein n=1 Tax=Sordaria brevicollis TaxID=83679 RepID=A0AAE0UAI8_SORBR|nr:hypothetical protein B0T20DRAFT_471465 [Sordaria brevicollis]